MSTIAVIGEAVADAIVQDAAVQRGGSGNGELLLRVLPGGGPVNTAVALSRLGTRTQFLGRLAAGSIGQLLWRHLAESQVDLSASVHALEMPTLAIASVDGAGRAEYDFYVEGTADWQWTEAELSTWESPGLVAVHAASLALARPPGAAVIESGLRRMRQHATVSIDPNVRTSVVPAQFYRDAVLRWAELADILRLSQDDLEVMMPGTSPEEACARLHEAGTPLVVVTQGPNGAYSSLRGEAFSVSAHDITPVDTVGAGDSFNAGLLHWLRANDALGGRMETLTTVALAGAMSFATAVAALTCQRPGANPPWAHELGVGAAGLTHPVGE